MRRYRKGRGSRSRVIKMKFQSFVDLATQADNMQIISVSAGGREVLKRLAPFFSAYKYYKLGGVSIKLIPASTLPVDPTGLSYSASEQTVDPRDQLTPGMCRITNGEDILEVITGLSGDKQRELYNNMLLDPRWYKWMLQSGVKRFGKPRYWQIGQLHQDKWPGSFLNLPVTTSAESGNFVTGTTHSIKSISGNGTVTDVKLAGSSPHGIFQTGHRGTLGWLPTDGLIDVRTGYDAATHILQGSLSAIPEVELFKILLPPMHKTNYYYRMFITETVYFKEPLIMNVDGFRPLDVFHDFPLAASVLPTTESSMTDFSDTVIDRETGGNDGSS